jgi:GNAT superfamily N-acetyltransferase
VLSLTHLARLEEARAAIGTREIALDSIDVGGGTAGRGATRTAWQNSAVGLGLGLDLRKGTPIEATHVPPEPPGGLADPISGPDPDHPWAVSRDDLEAMTAWYRSHDCEPKVEVCTHAHPSVMTHLCAMGYRFKWWESVLFLEMTPGTPVEAKVPLDPRVTVRVVSAQDDAACRELARLSSENFARPGIPITEDDLASTFRCIRHPRTLTLGAYVHEGGRDRCIGAGFMGVATIPGLGTLGALFGASTHPDWRRRGVQQALLAARMRTAQSRGATVATIGGTPGAGTERNVRRFGFQLGYAKIHMVV